MTDNLNFLVISNIIFEPYFQKGIKKHFSDISKIHISSISPEDIVNNNDDDVDILYDHIIVYLDFESHFLDAYKLIGGKLDLQNAAKNDFCSFCSCLYKKIKKVYHADLIWLGCEDYKTEYSQVKLCTPLYGSIIDEINCFLISLTQNDIYIDFKKLIANIGRYNSYNYKNKYRWNAPYSEELVNELCREIHKYYCCTLGKTKKCIVLDCDNVLWGGILIEDGIEGIRVGEHGMAKLFQDFQKFLVSLHNDGIILAVCSKNNYDDVLNVFQNHTGMVLKENHISVFRVNWESKAKNIQSISDTLNISLNSIVFIDDSVHEINCVKETLPDVQCIIFDDIPVYSKLMCINVSRGKTSDFNFRNETYKTDILRGKLKESCDSFEEYLSQLCMNTDIHFALKNELVRISELTMRANKCTNGQRYSNTELYKKMTNPDYSLYTVALKDKYSDLGIVGAFGICGNSLDLFVLSCRAFGRNIENKMFEYILNAHITDFYFTETGKNMNLLKQLNDLVKKQMHISNI